MSRRRLITWGTFCPMCRTVREKSTSVVCGGGHGTLTHRSRVVEVIDLYR